MFKCSIYHVSSWILFISALIIPCLPFNCIHDKVDEQERRSISTRSVKYQDIRAERDRNPNLFEPLDVHFYMDEVDSTVTLNTVHNVQLALRKARAYILHTFQVKKRKRPFLLERHSCTAKWKSGKNKGKCSKYNKALELCDTHTVKYVIPDRFLDKLEVYDFDKSQPNFVIASGPGLQNSNFITFVTFEYGSPCTEGALAFGSYCRLDHKTNEPLAGVLNLCPHDFAGRTKRFQYYYNVILHEMFHALGFSISLFDKFLPCEKGIYCDMPQRVIQEDDSKIFRLMFPLVIEKMQNHFGCSKSDFGGPLAMREVENATELKHPYSAHWHPVLMYSSIMTPRYSEFDDVFVDKMTLAAFDSTGWYRMNYSSADDFRFGLGQGCDFGLTGSCDNSEYLCNSSYPNYGCDLLHQTIGKCESLTFHHPCGVYVTNSTDCQETVAQHLDVDFDFIGYKHKCFMQQEEDSPLTPSCLPVRCKTEDTYRVLVNMTWHPCYQTEQISPNVTLQCPEGILFCRGKMPPVPSHFCPSDIYFFVAIRMYFDRPTFKELFDSNSFKNFKVTVLQEVANQIEIPVNYIVNSSLTVFKKIFLDFAICPPADLNAKELNTILKKAQKFLDRNFVLTLNGATDQFISSNNVKIDPVELISFSDYDGFRSLLAFPVICAIFLIASFVASVFRLFLLQKHRPKRPAENVNELQMSQIDPT